ncbi:LacI family DNA-binding transcriptional regulator [Caulobacter sp. RL271]|uniref:LacI family DNA-binding transcriptional regulator n=1 Tax=Caulobacter segnis TaxID=88688 RepID=A0ABY4ZZK9_9CAUL|nr:LacI family DNA-binding transcriptional regulator [Caulobacter segnis]USQ98059.1 LacI family DNA-binding transcriptional regulator [Caulobacter segnis]
MTIQAVAARANVSAMTVSHVLNGTKRVREETRHAVLDAVKTLGYVPNKAARQLASANAIQIGIVYRNAENEFLSAMLVGCLNAAANLGAQVLLRKCDTLEVDDAMEAVDWLVRGGANALLLNPPYCELLSDAGVTDRIDVPISAIAQGDPLPGIDCVGVDERAAACDMTTHLIERGHRRIGFVTGPQGQMATRARLDGYRLACAKHGIEIDPELIAAGNYSFGSGLAAGEALLNLRTPPTAIFASNDDMAAGVSLVAHQRGLKIPEDLAIAGFDDAPIAAKIWPPLSTVRQDVEALARRGVEMLVDRHRAKLGKARETVAIEDARAERKRHQVIARGST